MGERDDQSDSVDAFDPYREWLGVEGRRTPRRILGIRTKTPTPDELEDAFQQTYATIRQYQTGPHAMVAIRLLTEVTQAYHRLLNRVSRAEVRREKKRRRSQSIRRHAREQGVDFVPARRPSSRSKTTHRSRKSNARARQFRHKPRRRNRYVTLPDGTRKGPYSRRRLKRHARRNRFPGETLVWRPGWKVPLRLDMLYPHYFPSRPEVNLDEIASSEARSRMPVHRDPEMQARERMQPIIDWLGTWFSVTVGFLALTTVVSILVAMWQPWRGLTSGSKSNFKPARKKHTETPPRGSQKSERTSTARQRTGRTLRQVDDILDGNEFK